MKNLILILSMVFTTNVVAQPVIDTYVAEGKTDFSIYYVGGDSEDLFYETVSLMMGGYWRDLRADLVHEELNTTQTSYTYTSPGVYYIHTSLGTAVVKISSHDLDLWAHNRTIFLYYNVMCASRIRGVSFEKPSRYNFRPINVD